MSCIFLATELYDTTKAGPEKNCIFVSVLWMFFLYGNEPSLKVNTKILYSLAEDIYYIASFPTLLLPRLRLLENKAIKS